MACYRAIHTGTVALTLEAFYRARWTATERAMTSLRVRFMHPGAPICDFPTLRRSTDALVQQCPFLLVGWHRVTEIGQEFRSSLSTRGQIRSDHVQP